MGRNGGLLLGEEGGVGQMGEIVYPLHSSSKSQRENRGSTSMYTERLDRLCTDVDSYTHTQTDQSGNETTRTV